MFSFNYEFQFLLETWKMYITFRLVQEIMIQYKYWWTFHVYRFGTNGNLTMAPLKSNDIYYQSLCSNGPPPGTRAHTADSPQKAWTCCQFPLKMLLNLNWLRNSQRFCDVEILCGGKTIKVSLVVYSTIMKEILRKLWDANSITPTFIGTSSSTCCQQSIFSSHVYNWPIRRTTAASWITCSCSRSFKYSYRFHLHWYVNKYIWVEYLRLYSLVPMSYFYLLFFLSFRWY